MSGPKIVQPSGWVAPIGYVNGLIATGRHLMIAGQIGWNANAQFETDDLVGQVEQALRNIDSILRTAGGEPRHLVRLIWYVIDKAEYVARRREIGAAYRRVFGRHFPTMTLLVVAGLLETRAKVEIEATAVLP